MASSGARNLSRRQSLVPQALHEMNCPRASSCLAAPRRRHTLPPQSQQGTAMQQCCVLSKDISHCWLSQAIETGLLRCARC